MGLLKVVNWITTQISQKQWKASGYQEAMLENIKQINEHISKVEDVKKDIKTKTDEELDKELQS